MMQEYIFHVHGMHCTSCVGLIEMELGELNNIRSVKADLVARTVTVLGNFDGALPKDIAQKLSGVLTKHGYRLDVESERKNIPWHEFWYAAPIAFVFLGLLFFLQKLGLVNAIGSGEVTYGTAFVVGVIASLSTCVAVVGGLVLSLSANFAKGGDKIKPQVLFHIGRIISFFLFGGLLSAAGMVFSLGRWGTLSLTVVAGFVMLVLGMNLLDVFPWAKKLQPTLPAFMVRHIHEFKKVNHILTPFLLGALTFFLPCGFTQSMQLYAFSLGDFFSGSLMLFVFALGTFPVLGLLSFASLGVRDTMKSGIFFKTAGIIVIFFALLNLANSLVIAGIIPPFLNL